MKKYLKFILVLISCLILSGCVGQTSLPKFPDIPEGLQTSCPDLDPVKDNERKLSEVLKVVSGNYEKYHECNAKVLTWMDWYDSQKKIYEEIEK